MPKKLLRIAITGGAGFIAYNLLFRIASGELFGRDVPIALHILEPVSMIGALEGVRMELEDCAFDTLQEIHVGSDPFHIFKDVDWAVLIGAKPRSPGMERKDLLEANGHIFAEQGKALSEVASKDVRVLVVGNPCNTNCLIALHNAKTLKSQNFYAMTRLDHNRAKYQLAAKAGVSVGEITQMTIWGNHSTTQVPDFYHAKISGLPAYEVIKDMQWLQENFVSLVQKRGAMVLEARGKSSAASAASSIIDTIHSLIIPTTAQDWFSIGLHTKNNNYEIDPDLVFSFPCVLEEGGTCATVSGIEWNDFLRKKICCSEQELKEERDIVRHLLG